MQALDFLKKIETMKTSVLTLNDISKIINKNKEYSRLYIYRLKKRNIITEIEKNKYTLSDEPYEVASNLIFPSYISFISAYSIYGLTTQIPKTIYIVSSKPKKSLIFNKMTINFVVLKNVFGYRKMIYKKNYLFVAELEKAIIDSLYLPKFCPISETFEVLKNKIDIEKLLKYALLMNSIVLLKRLGFLLDLISIDISKKVKINNRYDLLNPYLKKSKNNSVRWRLNINEVLE
ncbi:hypothetical protein J4436_03835 [Candidatus Woesearchaeota archaeon]|nr:hypothetical protein [Candidatus Woesearchaeota archaeon]